MAYERKKGDKEEEKTGTLKIGGSGGAITGTSKSAPSTNKNKPTNSGSFTNIQDYVNANQGNSEAFADQTINTLDEGVDSAMNTAQAEVDSYRDAVTAATVVDNEELRGTDLTDIANDSDKLAEYQAGLNATYGGPDAFVSEQGFSDIDQTSGVINRTDNFSGMNSALQDTYGQQGGYTGGESLLDTTLLTRPKENRERFSQLRNRVTDSVDKFEADTKDNTQAWAEAAKRTTDATRQAYTDDITADQAALDQSIQNTVDTTNQQRQADYNAAMTPSNPGILNEAGAWLSTLPEANMGGQVGYGGDVAASQVVTPEQVAQYQALASIVGDTAIDGNIITNPYSEAAVETPEAYSQAAVDTYNNQRNQAALQNKEVYDNATNSLVNDINTENMSWDWWTTKLPANPFGYMFPKDYLEAQGGNALKRAEASWKRWRKRQSSGPDTGIFSG